MILLEALAAALLLLGSFLILKTLVQADRAEGWPRPDSARPPRRDSPEIPSQRRAA